eukprot:6952166-Pyramimonas_sp.AAC.1
MRAPFAAAFFGWLPALACRRQPRQQASAKACAWRRPGLGRGLRSLALALGTLCRDAAALGRLDDP